MPTILVVDDDPEFLAAVTPVLSNAGHVVVQLTDGAEALRRLESDSASFDAAIIDLNLPGVGGFQVIGSVGRGNPEPIPVLAITGAYSDIYLEVARYLGAQVALQKPEPGASLTGVLESLQTILDGQNGKRSPASHN
jgi:CheY-like chemotaxis protein